MEGRPLGRRRMDDRLRRKGRELRELRAALKGAEDDAERLPLLREVHALLTDGRTQ
ncbi:hypothetical protein [Streptomyces mangrovi]|uniref:hypothetical protein n=1 Tax=Streptomyces mangrovi TaxID=1206892 RepID=UPI00399C577E